MVCVRGLKLMHVCRCRWSSQAGAAAALEAALGRASVLTMASGTVNGMTKLYTFAQEAGSNHFFFCELIVVLASGAATITIKADHAGSVQVFQQHLVRALQSLVL